MKKNFSCDVSIKTRVSRATFATYFVIVLMFLLFRTLFAFHLFDWMSPLASSIVSTVFIQVVLMFSLSVFMFGGIVKRKPKEVLKFFGFKKLPKMAWLYAALLGVIVFFLNSYIAEFFTQILVFLGFRSASTPVTSYPWWLFLLNILLTAILPAICEETAHRGLLLKGSLAYGNAKAVAISGTLSIVKAIAISGLMFGLLHMNIRQFFYASLIGFYLGYVALHTDSILPGIVIHFLNNALNVALSYACFCSARFQTFVNNLFAISSQNLLFGIVFNVCFLALLVIGLVYFSAKLFFCTAQNRVEQLQAHIFNSIVRHQYISETKEVLGDEENGQQFDMRNEFFDKNISLGYMTDLDRQLIEDRSSNSDPLTTTFVVLIFVMGVATTILTLLEGLI